MLTYYCSQRTWPLRLTLGVLSHIASETVLGHDDSKYVLCARLLDIWKQRRNFWAYMSLISSQYRYPSLFLSIYLSIYLSQFVHEYLSLFISIYLSIYQSIYLSIPSIIFFLQKKKDIIRIRFFKSAYRYIVFWGPEVLDLFPPTDPGNLNLCFNRYRMKSRSEIQQVLYD